MKRFLILLSLVLLISGCAGRGMIGSFCGPLPSPSAVTSIAYDAVDLLASSYPPGHTSVYLMPAKNADNAFAQAMENSLRSRGFIFLRREDRNALIVAYTLDSLDDGSAWYLQLRLSDGRALARAYDVSGLPEAGRSSTVSGSSRSLTEQVTDAGKSLYDKAATAVSE